MMFRILEPSFNRRVWLRDIILAPMAWVGISTREHFLGGQISLLVGIVATLVSIFIGVIYGVVSGYYGGRVDALMMRIVDILYAMPFMFFVILLMVLFGRHLILVFIAIGAVNWLDMARIVRGQTLILKNSGIYHRCCNLWCIADENHRAPSYTQSDRRDYCLYNVDRASGHVGRIIFKFFGIGSSGTCDQLGSVDQRGGRSYGICTLAFVVSGNLFSIYFTFIEFSW